MRMYRYIHNAQIGSCALSPGRPKTPFFELMPLLEDTAEGRRSSALQA
jgi:hypothetical protein